MADEIYYLKEGEVELDDENEYDYREVDLIEDGGALSSDGEEDYDTTVRQIELTKAVPLVAAETKEEDRIEASSNVEVLDDFVRNFLVSMGLQQTAHCFETEWYELSMTGQLSDQYKNTVPDIYVQNRLLQHKIEQLESQLKDCKEATKHAREKFVQLRKERDYHRMHHRRILQEKEKLMTDIRRMKEHFSSYDNMLNELKNKFETTNREKLLASLERDKAIAEVKSLQYTLQSLRPSSSSTVSHKSVLPPIGPPHQQSNEESKKHLKDMIPNEPANPYFNKPFPNCAHLTRIDGFQLTGTIKAHDYGISSIDIHPTKSIIATGSDDHTWRAWTVPDGDHLMTGEGHTDWLSSVKFHPKGELLASTSGDGTVKVWNISQSTSPTITLSDHRQPVWGCSWHWSGLLLASVGMDHCCRLWDIQSEECVLSLRGHADSVNNVHFLSYSNVLATCSADKTVALWDIRTGLCIQTFYHHQNACNDVIANYQATEMYSADCFGVVIKWDLQTYKCISHWDLGPFPTNTLAIDPANTVLACGSGSERISLIELESNKTSNLSTNGNIEGISYGHKAEIMYSVDSNGFIGVWQ